MDPRLVTSVLSLLAVLLGLAHGYPQEASKSSPLESLTKLPTLEDTNTGEKKLSPERPKNDPAASLGTKLKVHFPSEDSKPDPTSKEENDDSVRSPRQSPMTFGHGPQLTTVCIQVRSDHHRPEVVCGPQVEEKKEEPPAARYAYPEYYTRATPQYPVRYAQQPPPPMPMAPPPAPVRVTPIYPARRREETIIKPVEQIIPQPPPVQVISVPQPTPMYINRQYVPLMPAASLYSQSSPLLKLNCGVQSEGAQLLNSPLLRSSSSSLLMGYYPVSEQVILGPSGEQQSVLSSSARMSSGLIGQESPYAYSSADPWSSAAYLGESSFYPMDMQGRSAGSNLDQSYSNALIYPSESAMDESAWSLLQEQELQQNRLKLRMLQNQLRQLSQRTNADEAQKGAPASDNPQSHDTSSGHEQKKDHTVRPSKRQTKTKEI